MALIFPLLYAVFVIGLCAYLLARGVTHLFIILFAVGAVLHAIPTLGICCCSKLLAGIGSNLNWIGALTAFGVLGTITSVAAFLSLATFLLRTPSPQL